MDDTAFTNRFKPMARPTPALIAALRETAQRLRDGAPYAWSLMSQCNCGHLAQTLTQMSSKQIQQRALQRAGDWTAQAIDYCPSSGLPMEDIFASMLAAGLSQADVGHPLVGDRNGHALAHLGLRWVRGEHTGAPVSP